MDKEKAFESSDGKEQPDSDFPDDHPIRQVWRDNAARTPELIKIAESGDKDVARELMGSIIMSTYNKRAPNQLIMEWLSRALIRILNGDNPIAALGLSTGRKGRPSLSKDERYKEAKIACAAHEIYAECGKKEAAYMAVADQHGVSESEVKDAHKKYFPEEYFPTK